MFRKLHLGNNKVIDVSLLQVLYVADHQQGMWDVYIVDEVVLDDGFV